jgi:signal transduction histidine kinase/uncharacterized protein YbjT (DUF2867 family)
MIAITGAEGQLGSLVLEGLLKVVAPDHLVALVRRPERAAGLVARAVRVRPGDYSSPEALALALSGVKRLLLISDDEFGPQVADHRALIEAAKTAGSEFIAYASVQNGGSVARPVAVKHKITEELLRSSGIPFVILRNGCARDDRVEAVAYAAAAVAVLTADGQNDTTCERAGDRDLVMAGSGALGGKDATAAEYRLDDTQRANRLRPSGQRPNWERDSASSDGSQPAVPIGSALRAGAPEPGIACVIDFPEPGAAEAVARKRVRRHHEVPLELTHANRVATMGELTCSIAHEVRQSLSAVAINGSAALNWLSRQSPDIEEARIAIEQIIRDAQRGSEVIARIRELAKKAPPLKEALDINETVREVIVLTRSEAVTNRISVQTELAEDLPPSEGDRVQLQQVLLNLVVNAIQAMASVAGGARQLRITTAPAGSSGVLVRVADSGPGLDPQTRDHVFEPYYTTKTDGLGMGLAICRSIIDAHDGRLWACTNTPRGAVFQFTLPAKHFDQARAQKA